MAVVCVCVGVGGGSLLMCVSQGSIIKYGLYYHYQSEMRLMCQERSSPCFNSLPKCMKRFSEFTDFFKITRRRVALAGELELKHGVSGHFGKLSALQSRRRPRFQISSIFP